MAKYRVGIIGCGSHGNRIARAFQLNPLTEVVAGANRGQEVLDVFTNRFGVPGYNSYEELLKNEKIDIAAPILPVKTNPEIVVACAEAGVKGILCEKPIALSLREADWMVEECRKRNIPLGAGDMFRNAPEIWKARELVESGELGKVQSINVYDTGSNQASGQGCRGYTEMAMFARDEPIDWVVGWVDGDPADRELGTVDEWSDNDQGIGGVVHYANGVQAFAHNRVTGKKGIEVVCSDGALEISEYRIGKIWKRDGNEMKYAGSLFPENDDAIVDLSQGYDEDGWQKLRTRLTDSVQALIDAVELGVPVKCSGQDLRVALEVPIALRESHRRGHAKVTLPLEDRSLKIIPSKRRHIGRKFLDEGVEGFLEHLRPLTRA